MWCPGRGLVPGCHLVPGWSRPAPSMEGGGWWEMSALRGAQAAAAHGPGRGEAERSWQCRPGLGQSPVLGVAGCSLTVQ